jgi:hypothetical protein
MINVMYETEKVCYKLNIHEYFYKDQERIEIFNFMFDTVMFDTADMYFFTLYFHDWDFCDWDDMSAM